MVTYRCVASLTEFERRSARNHFADLIFAPLPLARFAPLGPFAAWALSFWTQKVAWGSFPKIISDLTTGNIKGELSNVHYYSKMTRRELIDGLSQSIVFVKYMFS